ncbi:AraC family transcriptional regulator [Lachnospiraceae bacterium ZAX-1]
MTKKQYLYVQEVGYFITKSPYFTEHQNLNSYLVVVTKAGKGYLTYEGVAYPLTKGTCFYIDCRKHHEYHADSKEEWEFVWIHFDGATATEYYQSFIQNGFRILPVFDESKIESAIWSIIAACQKKNLKTELLTANLIHTIMTECLVLNYTRATDLLFIPPYIKAIAKEIDQNFREDLSLGFFAERHHRSKYHISKEFKRYIGISLHGYIILARIACGKELLKYTTLSVEEIAHEVGVNHATHFINLFKQREKTTPLAYRKEWHF